VIENKFFMREELQRGGQRFVQLPGYAAVRLPGYDANSLIYNIIK